MKNMITYVKNSSQKDVITYFQISKDVNGILLIYLRLKDKYLNLDIHPQITCVKTLKDGENKSYLLCFCEDEDNNNIATFEIDIPLEIYNKYLGMTNFHYSKNKEEYYIMIHPQEFDYDNKTILVEKKIRKRMCV